MTLSRLPVRLAAAWPAALLVLVALAFLPMDRLPSFDVLKLVILIAGALFVTVASLRRREKSARDAVLADPILALPLLMAIAAAIGGIVAWPAGSLTGAVTAIACVAVARLVAQADDAAAAFRTIARGAAVAAAVAGIYALVQKAGLDFTPWAARREVVSTFGNTSFAAEFQAAALPLSVFIALTRGARPADRVLGAAAVVLGATHLVMAKSRIDLLAIAAAVGVGVCLWTYATGRRRLAAGIATAGVVAGLGLGAAFVSMARGGGPEWLGRSDTIAVRADIWKSTTKLVAASPIRVAGASFIDLYPSVRSPGEYRTSLGRRVDTPHNDFLEIAVALGIPGLVAALAVLALVARRVVAASASAPAESAALGASIAAVAVSALASSPLSHPPVALLLACVAGLVVALVPRPWRGLTLAVRGLDVAFAAAALVAFAFGPAWRSLRSDGFLALGRSELAAGNGSRALVLLDLAAAVDAQAFDARYELGSVLRSARQTDGAVAALESAHALRPGDFDCRVNLAYALRDAGRRAEADRLLDESLALCDWHPLLLAAKAILALDDRRESEAVVLARRAAAGLPTDPRLAALAAECRLAFGNVTASSGERPPTDPCTLALPDVADACLDALGALFRSGDVDELGRSTRSMLRRDRNLLGPLVTRSRRLAAEDPDLAVALLFAAATGVTDDAGFFDDGSRVLRDVGRAEDSTIFLGRALGIRADQALARGETSRALKYAEQAAERAPSPHHYLTVARAAAKLGERGAAIESIGAAVASGPVDPDAVRADPVLGGLLPDRRLEDVLERAAQRRGENHGQPGPR